MNQTQRLERPAAHESAVTGNHINEKTSHRDSDDPRRRRAGKFAGLAALALTRKAWSEDCGRAPNAKQGDIVRKQGAEIAIGDLRDGASLDATLKDVWRAYLQLDLALRTCCSPRHARRRTACSTIRNPRHGRLFLPSGRVDFPTPRALGIQEIAPIVETFAQATRNAVKRDSTASSFTGRTGTRRTNRSYGYSTKRMFVLCVPPLYCCISLVQTVEAAEQKEPHDKCPIFLSRSY
jgi:hypothetical protein